MKLKDKINMHLDLYTNELSILIDEAHCLYNTITSKPNDYWFKNRSEFNSIVDQINSIESSKNALEQCKNDSIKNL